MRTALAPRADLRGRFSGTFARLGTRRGWQGRTAPTVLLQDIRDHAGELVADHIWLNLTTQLAAMQLVAGDVLFFDARVTLYEKGYKGRREDVDGSPIEFDYKLSRPAKIVKAAPDTQGLWL